mgnify:CR=1 FL=1
MATTSWASAGRELKKDVGDEEFALGKAAGKKSLWSSLGGTIGSLGMMAALGPLGIAANPLLAGLAVGGGSLAGSKLGGGLLTSKKNKEILSGQAEGLKFLGDERKEISDEIEDTSLASALTAGTTAGMSAWSAAGNPDPNQFSLNPKENILDKMSSGFKTTP